MIKVFIFICILTLFSCSQKSNKEVNSSNCIQLYGSQYTTDNLKEIELNPYDKGYMYDDLIDSVSFIKLQTTDYNLMAYVDRILFTDDKIIIIDSKKMKAIFVYDYQGNYLYRISQLGEGPNEYRSLSYVTLNLDKSQIIVVDIGAQKLKYFSINNRTANITGSFLVKSIDLPYIFDAVELLTDDIIAGYYFVGNTLPNTPNLYKFIISDLNKKIYFFGDKSFYNKKFTYTTSCPLQKFNSTVFFNPSYNDTIFSINKESLEAHYVINIKGHKNIVINENTTDETFKQVLKSNNFFNSYFIDLQDIAVFSYTAHMDWYTWGVYIKSENKTYNCNGKFQNPLFSYCHEQSFYYKDNILVKPVSANSLLLNKGALLKNNNSPQLKVIYENLTEDDNPVLLFYHMKTKIE